MKGSLSKRLHAAVMAVFFICAGIILPDLDAVIFHGASSQESSRSHVEAAGSGSCHAERCVLGAVLPQGQKAGTTLSSIAKFFEHSVQVLPATDTISDRSPSGNP